MHDFNAYTKYVLVEFDCPFHFIKQVYHHTSSIILILLNILKKNNVIIKTMSLSMQKHLDNLNG